MLQQEAILPWKTAEDNVALGLVFQGRPPPALGQDTVSWLDGLGFDAGQIADPRARGVIGCGACETADAL